MALSMKIVKIRIVLLAICLNMNPFILKKTLSRNKYSNSKNLLFLSGIFIVHLVIINLFSLKKDVGFSVLLSPRKKSKLPPAAANKTSGSPCYYLTLEID